MYRAENDPLGFLRAFAIERESDGVIDYLVDKEDIGFSLNKEDALLLFAQDARKIVERLTGEYPVEGSFRVIELA
jgi:hypothetical protein